MTEELLRPTSAAPEAGTRSWTCRGIAEVVVRLDAGVHLTGQHSNQALWKLLADDGDDGFT